MLLLILCIITVCNQLLFKETVSLSSVLSTIVYTDGDIHLYLALKKSLIYLQNSFHCLINKTFNQINFSLLIICLSMSKNVNFINKLTVKILENSKNCGSYHGNDHMSYHHIKGNKSIVTYDINLNL